MLDTHLDEFKRNMGGYSEEQGKHFHQDILDFERHYLAQYNERMMDDDIRGLIRENDLQYCWKSRKSHAFLINLFYILHLFKCTVALL